MASISENKKDGTIRILFVAPDGKRKAIRLGKCSRRDSVMFKCRIENLLSAKILGKEPGRDDSIWLSKLSSVIRKRIERAGLVEPVQDDDIPLISEFMNEYIAGRTDLKESTVKNLRQAEKSMMAFCKGAQKITEFTPQDAADFRIFLLKRPLVDTTVRRRCKRVKQIFAAAIKKKIITGNPFDDVPTANRTNKDRQRNIKKEDIQSVIDACPNIQWKLIFALARYAGLRIPSELKDLKWENIFWDKKRFVVHSPKTEHIEGKSFRIVPIFPDLEPYLLEAMEKAEPGEKRVIPIIGGMSKNLRTQARRIIKRAGYEPWPKPFQNLRSSCETDLVEKFPLHVVTEWLGNSPEVAQKHYLQVTEEHYERATQKPAQYPTQQGQETTRKELKENQGKTISPDNCGCLRKVSKSFNYNDLQSLPPRGLETL